MVNRITGKIDEWVNNPHILMYWCARCAIKAKCQSVNNVWQDVSLNKYYASCYGRHHTNIMNYPRLFNGNRGQKRLFRKYGTGRFRELVPDNLFLSYCSTKLNKKGVIESEKNK